MRYTAIILIIGLLALSACRKGPDLGPDLNSFCNYNGQNDIGKVYSCDNHYLKLEHNNLGGGISWMVPGDPGYELRCPVVGPDSMSALCKELMNNPPKCGEPVICPQQNPDNGTQIANPASVNCVNLGGQLEIRDTPAGQVGYCLINGTECEEWALFRGECTPSCGTCPQLMPASPDFCKNGTIVPSTPDKCGCIGPPGCAMPNATEQAGFTACPSEKPTGPVACTMEWMPVCGKLVLNTGATVYQTFGNKCDACAALKVVGYMQGECPNPAYVECNHTFARGEMCTTLYDPVCAQKDNGIRCIRAPCPSTDNVTYPSACQACKDEKVYGYVPGACENSTK